MVWSICFAFTGLASRTWTCAVAPIAFRGFLRILPTAPKPNGKRGYTRGMPTHTRVPRQIFKAAHSTMPKNRITHGVLLSNTHSP